MTYTEEYRGVYEGEWKHGKRHGRGVTTKYGEKTVADCSYKNYL